MVHDSRDTLMVHLREVHSIDIYMDLKYNSCNKIFNGKENLTKHKCPVHRTFQEVSRPVQCSVLLLHAGKVHGW